jgi:biopolymer transport protein ExbD
VELPGIFHPDPKLKGSLEPLTVSVNAAGELFLDKAPIDLPALEATLRERHAADPKQRVLLKGDKALGYATMRDLFRRCQDIGFPGVSLVVSDRARRGEAEGPPVGEGVAQGMSDHGL